MRPMAGHFTQRRFSSLSLSLVGSDQVLLASGLTGIDVGAIGGAAGDLCIYWDFAQSGTSTPPTAVTPTGFTRFHNQTIGGQLGRGCISAKILDGTEGTVNGMTAAEGSRKAIAVWHPSVPIAGFTANAMSNEGTTGNPAAQTILAAAAVSLPIIAYGQMCANTPISGASISPTMTRVDPGGARNFAHYLVMTTSDVANISYDMADSGNNRPQSGYLTFPLA